MLAAGQAATEFSGQFLQENEAAIKQKLVEDGMEIVEPANDEQEFIQLATEAVWPQYYDSIGGVEVLNQALAAIGRDPVAQ